MGKNVYKAMIHLMAFMDVESGIGRKIYSDGFLQITEELIWPMISALNNFVIECTRSERGLVNAALEDIKIYLYSPLGEANPLRFVFFTDLFDNNDYLELKGQAIFEILSPYINFEVFEPPLTIIQRAQNIAKYTQTFKKDILEENFLESLSQKFKNQEQSGNVYIADLFIGDIDQGKVFSFISNINLQEKDSIQLFSELLTTFSIDTELFISSSLSKKEERRLDKLGLNTLDIYEGWFLKQLLRDDCDFWLVSYFYYNKKQEGELKNLINELHKEISKKLSSLDFERPF